MNKIANKYTQTHLQSQGPSVAGTTNTTHPRAAVLILARGGFRSDPGPDYTGGLRRHTGKPASLEALSWHLVIPSFGYLEEGSKEGMKETRKAGRQGRQGRRKGAKEGTKTKKRKEEGRKG